MNSNLVGEKFNNPYYNSRGTVKIDTITIHCMQGNLSLSQCHNTLISNKVSCNYMIDSKGKIGLELDENKRSWCSSSKENDFRAITIEVASSSTYPYEVTDEALESLIDLCADICKRNGIKELLWQNDKNLIGQVEKQNMTLHCWFNLRKSCPGKYLIDRHSYIANEVNKRIKVVYYPKYEGKSLSLVDALKELGIDSSKVNRKSIALKNGFSNYDFSATSNLMLLNLLKKGQLIKA